MLSGYAFTGMCLFICKITRKLWTNFDKIFRKYRCWQLNRCDGCDVIQKFLNTFLIIPLKSNVGGVGPRRMSVLYECCFTSYS